MQMLDVFDLKIAWYRVLAAREPGFCGNDSETEGRKEKLNGNDQTAMDTTYHPVLPGSSARDGRKLKHTLG